MRPAPLHSASTGVAKSTNNATVGGMDRHQIGSFR
jgi:hypothetical protein